MGQFRACAVVVMVFVPWASSAQVTPPLTGRDMQSLRTAPPPPIAEVALPDLTDAEKSWLGACDTLYLTPPDSEFPADLAGAPNGYALIGACASDLAKKVTTLNEPDATMQNRALIRIRVNYKTLQRWVGFGRGTATGSGRETALKAVRDLDEVLADALKARKLFAQFSATLMTGPSFTDTKKDDKGDDKTKILALGVVHWETRHFGDVSLEPLDLSFGGRLGVEPVLTVVTPSDAAEGADTTLTGTQQSAFVWAFDVNAHRQHRAINAEYGWFARTGAAMLTTVPSLVDRDRGSFVALPADNGAGKTAWFWESGLQFTMFDNRLAQVHAEGARPRHSSSSAWRGAMIGGSRGLERWPTISARNTAWCSG